MLMILSILLILTTYLATAADTAVLTASSGSDTEEYTPAITIIQQDPARETVRLHLPFIVRHQSDEDFDKDIPSKIARNDSDSILTGIITIKGHRRT